MNKTIALAAIVMVAVVMGIGAIAPAAMATPSSGDVKHNPKELVCHFDRDTNDDGDDNTNDRAWEVKPLNKHSMVAHLAHGDIPIDNDNPTDLDNNTITEEDCGNQVALDPDF